MLLGLMALVTVVMHMVSAQNRGSATVRSNGESSEIVTNRTRAYLSCKSGDMVVTVNFTRPFRGLMYAYKSRNSPCRVFGSGGTNYVLRIPLKGCGTWQESPRVFVNNITIRFHPALELEEDETKTLVCRYPPPLTPSPSESIRVKDPISPPNKGTKNIQKARLSEVEILIIICVLLFLSLLTLGIGIAYFCLKKRNIHLVRRKTVSSTPPSQMTKLSNLSPQQSSLISGAILNHTVKIPRAVPYSASLRTHTVSDHPYERTYRSSSADVSPDSLELTPSTSTTSTESSDGTTHLLRFSQDRSGPCLTIPKAVLRKDRAYRRSFPEVHRRSSSTPPLKIYRSGELEDQIVTTVLEPESSDNSNNVDISVRSPTHSMPVYAQVNKKKHKVKIVEEIGMHRSTGVDEVDAKTAHETRREVLNLDTVRVSRSNEKNTTVTSTTRSRTTESKSQREKSDNHTNALLKVHAKEPNVREQTSGKIAKYNSTSPSLKEIDNPDILNYLKEEKSISIKDISDVFITTTVETESTEVKTTVTRDIIEEHVKDCRRNIDKSETTEDVRDENNSEKTESSRLTSPILKTVLSTNNEKIQISESPSSTETPNSQFQQTIDELESALNSPKVATETGIEKTNNWNVIIRQRKPSTTAKDWKSSENDSDDIRSVDQTSPIHFDVRIRTLPPKSASEKREATERRESTELVEVPQLQMPHSIEKLRDIMARLESINSEISSRESAGPDKISTDIFKTKAGHQTKAVKWSDDSKPVISTYSPEPIDSLASSETSLRERSSSEVLEKAPTLFSSTDSPNSNLERSTSEIVKTPENYNKQSASVPVFESYSPEFLSNIPVVSQGGFFNRTKEEDTAKKKEKKFELEIWRV